LFNIIISINTTMALQYHIHIHTCLTPPCSMYPLQLHMSCVTAADLAEQT
jgi:hypothetical protein